MEASGSRQLFLRGRDVAQRRKTVRTPPRDFLCLEMPRGNSAVTRCGFQFLRCTLEVFLHAGEIRIAQGNLRFQTTIACSLPEHGVFQHPVSGQITQAPEARPSNRPVKGYHVNSEYPYRFVRTDEVFLANPVIVGDLCLDDISSDWYIIVEYSHGEYLTIELDFGHLGRCYDSAEALDIKADDSEEGLGQGSSTPPGVKIYVAKSVRLRRDKIGLVSTCWDCSANSGRR